MNKLFTPQELLYYNRQLNLKSIGLDGQARLKKARVLYVGAGGLGSSALLYLAAAGVGQLGIIDDDTVDISNLHRQILYTDDDISHKKVHVAQKRLQQLNPFIQIITHDMRLSHNNAIALFSVYDIIADGSDNFETRYLINEACVQLKKPLVYASISQFEGQCSVLTTQNAPCYRCLFDTPPPPEQCPNCAEGGVLGALPGLLGTIQATEVIKLILGIGQPLIGRLLTVDALTMHFKELTLAKNPQCHLCQPSHTVQVLSRTADKENISALSVIELLALQQENTDFLLLDVRDPFEYAICNLKGTLIPLKELPHRLHELNPDQLIIVHCKYGKRSQQAATYLIQHGFTHVRYLQGGIMAWIEKIDATLQTY